MLCNSFSSIALNNRERRFSQPKLELYGLFHALHAYKIFIIKVRNLIVEVDTRYIRGMLNNPDIAPSASINRWIVSILTFHFKLRHVPGKHHGPDGLSRRPPRPEDLPDEDNPEDFKDWVDNLYGFIHLINAPSPAPSSTNLIHAFASEQVSGPSDTTNFKRPNPPFEYYKVPRSAAAIAADKQLMLAHDWLVTLKWSDDITDHEFALVTRYASGFFTQGSALWKRDAQGAHKRVIYYSSQIEALIVAHDNSGHKEYYATHSHIALRFWWPYMGHNVAWFVWTCHACQIRQTKQVLIPPTVTTPAPLFAKMYMDTMHMPRASGYSYIVQGRCSLPITQNFGASGKKPRRPSEIGFSKMSSVTGEH